LSQLLNAIWKDFTVCMLLVTTLLTLRHRLESMGLTTNILYTAQSNHKTITCAHEKTKKKLIDRRIWSACRRLWTGIAARHQLWWSIVGTLE
jgi:hypothetical protein